jgi:hypothetical protein
MIKINKTTSYQRQNNQTQEIGTTIAAFQLVSSFPVQCLWNKQKFSKNDQETCSDMRSKATFWNATASLQQQFRKLYGGESAKQTNPPGPRPCLFWDADEATSFWQDIVVTASCLHQAKECHPFCMAFAGTV